MAILRFARLCSFHFDCRVVQDWVPPELVGADIQQTLANLANAAAQVPDAAHQLNIDNDELEAAAELGAGA